MYTEEEMNIVARVLQDINIDLPSLMDWLLEGGNTYPGWWEDFCKQTSE